MIISKMSANLHNPYIIFQIFSRTFLKKRSLFSQNNNNRPKFLNQNITSNKTKRSRTPPTEMGGVPQ